MFRTLTLITVGLYMCNLAPAQMNLFNFEIGYNMHFMQPEGANFLVNRYNDTRSFLTQNMESFGYFDGFTIGVGTHGGTGSAYLETGFNGRAQKRTAEGTVQLIDYRRQLRFRHNTGYIGLGWVFGRKTVFIPGVRAEFGNLVSQTRIETVDNFSSAKWEKIHSHLHGYASPFLKIIVGLIAIEPYYSFTIFGDKKGPGLEEVNKVINEYTFQQDPDYIPFEGGGFGIRVIFSTGGLGVR